MIRLALVVSDFNKRITSKMEKDAISVAKSLGAEVIESLHVPGTFEIPFGVKKLIKKGRVDGIAALGAVIKGDTDHDIVIVNAAAKEIADLSVQYDMPVGFGIIGPGVTLKKAESRLKLYSRRSIESAVALAKLK